MTPIRYIGTRPEYIEGTYGSRLVFVSNEVKNVPDDLARKLLKHPDVYEQAGESTGHYVEADTVIQEPDYLEDARDFVINMDKDMLAEFAQTNFRMSLDKRKSVENLRSEVVGLIDQYGLPL